MIWVRNQSLERIGKIDKISSLKWQSKYYAAGSFEAKCPYSKKNFELLRDLNFICIEDKIGVIEYVGFVDDMSGSAELLIKGRDAKALLDWRINWDIFNFAGTIESFMRALVEKNITAPAVPTRKIPIITLGDPAGIADRIQIQDTGSNLLELFQEIAPQYGIGFDLRLVGNTLQFIVYRGADRSATAKFSRAYNNITTVDLVLSSQKYKNTTWIAGSDEAENRIKTSIEYGAGLERREFYTDARDLRDTQTVDGAQVQMPMADYIALLQQRGKQKLAERPKTFAFDADVNLNSGNLVYGKDCKLGDVVSVVDKELGIKVKPRITEEIIVYQNGSKDVSVIFGDDIPA